jgi:hypothetical protein
MSDIFASDDTMACNDAIIECLNANGRACIKLPGMRLKYGILKGSATHRRLVSEGKVPADGSGWMAPASTGGRWRYGPRTLARTCIQRTAAVLEPMRASPDVGPFMVPWLSKYWDACIKRDALVRVQRLGEGVASLASGRFVFALSTSGSTVQSFACIAPSSVCDGTFDGADGERVCGELGIPFVADASLRVTTSSVVPSVADVCSRLAAVLAEGGVAKRSKKKRVCASPAGDVCNAADDDKHEPDGAHAVVGDENAVEGDVPGGDVVGDAA